MTTGANTYLAYRWEDNGLREDPTDTTDKRFGVDDRLGTAEGTNRGQHVNEPGARVPIDTVSTGFDGNWSVDATLSNPWWLRAFLGEASTTDNGDGTYTHTFDDQTTTGTTPLRIFEVYSDGSVARELHGCIAERVRLSPQVNSKVRLSLSGRYAFEQTDSATNITAQPEAEYDAMTFADAEVSIGGSRVALAQSADITAQQRLELDPELGTRFPVDYSTMVLEPRMNLTKVKKAGDETNLIEDMYGQAGATQVQENVTDEDEVTATFSKSAGGTNDMTFTFPASFPDSYSDSAGDPTQRIEGQLTRMLRGMTASVTNTTASAP